MEPIADGTMVALTVARAVHFAACAIVLGCLATDVLVLAPALRQRAGAPARTLRRRVFIVVFSGLGVALPSGFGWFALQAASMSGLPLTDALAPDVIWTVLTGTRFGLATLVHGILAIALAATMIGGRTDRPNWPATMVAACFVAAIAWTGHAGAEPGAAGNLHLIADVLHLLCASIWLGGLLPLAMALIASGRGPGPLDAALAREVTTRFSTLGLASVGLLVVTGCINAVLLIGSPGALTASTYGRLLLVKLGLFAVILSLAAVNREFLRPRLLAGAPADRPLAAQRWLAINSVAEIGLGLAIFAVVGALGILHPAIHAMD